MLGFISFIVGLALKFWNGMKPPIIVAESEKAGSLQQALDTEVKTNEQIEQIAEVRNNVVPLTADQLREPEHSKANDPDFRD